MQSSGKILAATAAVFLAVMVCASASYVLNGRVMARFGSIPANRVKQIASAIASGYSKPDILPTSVEFVTTTNNGVISGFLTIDFTASNNAAAMWSTLTNYSFPPNTTGSLSFHMCAISSLNTNGYIPCNSTGAFYQVKNFP